MKTGGEEKENKNIISQSLNPVYPPNRIKTVSCASL